MWSMKLLCSSFIIIISLFFIIIKHKQDQLNLSQKVVTETKIWKKKNATWQTNVSEVKSTQKKQNWIEKLKKSKINWNQMQ